MYQEKIASEETLLQLVNRYKTDAESVYNTWFINNDDRLKAFRTIRRGVHQVIADIKAGTFGNDFKGSSLEFVLSCIAEQKQVFVGIAHPFYWKPKLRIPDIYENEANKRAFGQFLQACLTATKEEQLLREIILLDQKKIKGLGPAVASILYFLHPTLIPPFNTAIVNGFNKLFGENIKLGSWKEYLRMRELILQVNNKFRPHLSTDLGAIGGLLFDIGDMKILATGQQAIATEDILKIERQLAKRHKEVMDEQLEDNLHTEMQYHLLKVGRALGYDVSCASNDKSKKFQDDAFSFLCMGTIPDLGIDKETQTTIGLIDVLWFEKHTNKVAAAFEVEKSTSIYSGILRLTDLHYSLGHHVTSLYLIVPDNREKEVRLQLSRPSIRSSSASFHYILFSELRTHCDAI